MVVSVFANQSMVQEYALSLEGVDRVMGNTKSLCLERANRLDAVIFEEGRKVKMRKRCPEHGEFEDVIPFCTYNAIHRDAIEKKFSKPIEGKYGNKGS